MARDAGARKVYFASAAPPVKYPNVYGIDIPSCTELVAFERSEEDVAVAIGADKVIYNNLEDVVDAVKSLNPALTGFDTSCFNGKYVTPEVTEEYLKKLVSNRGKGRTGAKESAAATAITRDDCSTGYESDKIDNGRTTKRRRVNDENGETEVSSTTTKPPLPSPTPLQKSISADKVGCLAK